MERFVKQALGVGALLVGSLAMICGCTCWQGGEEKDETITMTDLPAAVKTAAEKEIGGGKVYEVEKELKNGQAVYEIVYDDAGAKMELKYDEAGKLLKKEKD